MRRLLRAALLGLPALLAACAPDGAASGAAAGPCPAGMAGPGAGACLASDTYGPARAETLFVVLHGDLSGGGPARYQRAWAQRIAAEMPGSAVVALVRPGYANPEGRTSSGDNNGRRDHYTPANIALVAGAVDLLRAQTGARHVIGIGHSGGAATFAAMLALHPGTLDGAALLACPCDLVAWRAGRQPWARSADPARLVDRIPATARVAAFTGSADDATRPALAQGFVEALTRRGIAARFTEVPGAGHNQVVDAAWAQGFGAALADLARAPGR